MMNVRYFSSPSSVHNCRINFAASFECAALSKNVTTMFTFPSHVNYYMAIIKHNKIINKLVSKLVNKNKTTKNHPPHILQ